MWNERYAASEYVYGTAPNEFLKEVIDKLKGNGKVLFPAEGEGRNAVYEAKKGFDVTAFDLSIEGQKKALNLASMNKVKINYLLGSVDTLDLPENYYNVVGLIYAHMPTHLRAAFHNRVAELVAPGGAIILEGFSKENLKLRLKNPKIGGPDKVELLFSTEEIQNDFKGFGIEKLEELEVDLQEGLLHNGKAKVIRFIGKKLV